MGVTQTVLDAALARSAACGGVDGLHALSLACAHASIILAVASASSASCRSRSRRFHRAALSLQRACDFDRLEGRPGGTDRGFAARLLRLAEAIDVFHPVPPFQCRATD